MSNPKRTGRLRRRGRRVKLGRTPFDAEEQRSARRFTIAALIVATMLAGAFLYDELRPKKPAETPARPVEPVRVSVMPAPASSQPPEPEMAPATSRKRRGARRRPLPLSHSHDTLYLPEDDVSRGASPDETPHAERTMEVDAPPVPAPPPPVTPTPSVTNAAASRPVPKPVARVRPTAKFKPAKKPKPRPIARSKANKKPVSRPDGQTILYVRPGSTDLHEVNATPIED